MHDSRDHAEAQAAFTGLKARPKCLLSSGLMRWHQASFVHDASIRTTLTIDSDVAERISKKHVQGSGRSRRWSTIGCGPGLGWSPARPMSRFRLSRMRLPIGLGLMQANWTSCLTTSTQRLESIDW